MTFKFSSPSGNGYCDARCQNATEIECNCSCGGTNHGVGISSQERSNQKRNFLTRIKKLIKQGYTVQPPLIPQVRLITKNNKRLTKEEQEFALFQYYKEHGSPFLEKEEKEKRRKPANGN